MWRRCTIAVAMAGLASMAGCGLIQSGLNTHQAHESGAVTTTLDAPVNRVLMAAQEASVPDFLFEDEANADFPVESISARGMKALNGGLTSGKVAFEAEISLEEVNFGSGRLLGRTKDGRLATLWLLKRDHGKKTEVSLRIGKPNDAGLNSDADLIFAFFDRIEDKLAHPSPVPKGETGTRLSVDMDFDLAPKKAAAPVDQKGPDR